MKRKVLLAGEKKEFIDDKIKRDISQVVEIYECKTEKEIIDVMRKEIIHLAILCIDSDSAMSFQIYKRILMSKICDKSTMKIIPVFFVGEEKDCISVSSFSSISDAVFFNTPLLPELFYYHFCDIIDINKGIFLSPEQQEKMAGIDIIIKGRLGEKHNLPQPPKKKKNETNDGVMCLDKDILDELNELDIDEIEKELEQEAKKNILIVDDDLKVLKLMSAYLEEDYNVVIAKSGESALKYLRKNEPDLILLDYMMPGETGADVFNSIRMNTKCKTTPIIFLTGIADAEVVKEIVKLKPQGYILKPVNKETLREKIRPYI